MYAVPSQCTLQKIIIFKNALILSILKRFEKRKCSPFGRNNCLGYLDLFKNNILS